MANKANSLSHTKWMCKCHIVFTPKYRWKIIYQDKWKINDAYFSNINENSKDEYWKEYFGINDITKKKLIKASVRAYNDESFIRLAEFKTSGSFDIKKLKDF